MRHLRHLLHVHSWRRIELAVSGVGSLPARECRSCAVVRLP